MNAFAQRNQNSMEQQLKAKAGKMTKIAKYVGIGLVTLGIASTFVTTVEKGHVGVPVVFNEIDHSKFYTEGLNIKMPWVSVIEVPVVDRSITLKGIVIDNRGKAVSNGQLVLQTADKMDTGVDVEILVNMKPQYASKFVQQAGSFDGAVNQYVIPALKESMYDQGAAIATAQDLFTTEAKDQLKAGSIQDMQGYLNNKVIMGALAGGFNVKDVKYQRLALPSEINKMIMATKQRQEQEDIAKSSETIRKTDADAALYEEKQKALATEAQADAEAHRRTVNAEAAEKEADAKFYAMKKDAEGIELLNKQINPEYIQYINAQAGLEAAQNYKGDVPQSVTSMGTDANFVPFMNMK